MSLIRSCLAAASVIMIFACASPEAEPADSMMYEGQYVWGAEVEAFTPCDSQRDYWVTGSAEMTRALERRYREFGLPPYEAVYVRFEGQTGPPLEDGFAADYDGSVRVDSLIEMRLDPWPGCSTRESWMTDVPRGAADTIFLAATLDTLRDSNGDAWLLISGHECTDCDAPAGLYLRSDSTGEQHGPYSSPGEHFQMGDDEGPPDARIRVFVGDCVAPAGDDLVLLIDNSETSDGPGRSAYVARLPDAGNDAAWTAQLESEVTAAVAAGRCIELPGGTHYS